MCVCVPYIAVSRGCRVEEGVNTQTRGTLDPCKLRPFGHQVLPVIVEVQQRRRRIVHVVQGAHGTGNEPSCLSQGSRRSVAASSCGVPCGVLFPTAVSSSALCSRCFLLLSLTLSHKGGCQLDQCTACSPLHSPEQAPSLVGALQSIWQWWQSLFLPLGRLAGAPQVARLGEGGRR